MFDQMKIGWLAGLLEGEGCFFLPAKGPISRHTQIALAMADKDVIDRVAKIWAKKTQTSVPKNPKWSTIYRITLTGQRGVNLMQSLRSLMGERRQERIDKILAGYHPFRRSCCEVLGCYGKHVAKGLCNRHYLRVHCLLWRTPEEKS